VLILLIYLFTKRITLNTKITIEQGENVSKIFNQLGTIEKFRIKLYLFSHKDISFSKLEAGSYTFSGNYTKSELIQQILKGSEKDYLRLTILEGRSVYDIDEALARK
jgi:cell division protein YceG involved in septum cleavage